MIKLQITVQRSVIIKTISSGRNFADSAENPRGWWLLVERIHAKIWVVGETRIQAGIQGKF